jgi:hypothetical protein
MNVAEGAKRMRRAGQWMILIPLIALALLWGLAMSGAPPMLELAQMNLPLSVLSLGAALWLAGWIVEGFAKEKT